jgi:peptidoglycan/LPS O-acetylase OafA/YrhL
MIILVVVGCVVSGILVHKLVEVPVTRFARRWKRRPSKEPAAASSLTEPRRAQA